MDIESPSLFMNKWMEKRILERKRSKRMKKILLKLCILIFLYIALFLFMAKICGDSISPDGKQTFYDFIYDRPKPDNIYYKLQKGRCEIIWEFKATGPCNIIHWLLPFPGLSTKSDRVQYVFNCIGEFEFWTPSTSDRPGSFTRFRNWDRKKGPYQDQDRDLFIREISMKEAVELITIRRIKVGKINLNAVDFDQK